MKRLYDLGFAFAKAMFPLAATFDGKFSKGLDGRKQTWTKIDQLKNNGRSRLWVHAASLGEFEQVVPILEKIDRERWQVVITFFSPSGYEQKKDTPLADVTAYLPWDTKKQARRFIETVDPNLVLMVKYEFWPNFLDQLQKGKVPAILVSGSFREDMPFFKWYGRWMQKYLHAFDHFYVQNMRSLELLHKLGFDQVTVSGDTRFDRAAALIEQDNGLDFMEVFVDDRRTMVVGSSWPDDIDVLKDSISAQAERMKTVIAPHEVQSDKIKSLRNQLGLKAVCWSELEKPENPTTRDSQVLTAANILIIDTIGQLTKVYSYADIAYVGGAMGTTGLHNILEAATFSVPVLIGKNYQKFPEAAKLRELGGLFSVTDKTEVAEILEKLLLDDRFRESTGQIGGHWIDSNTGASRIVVDKIRQYSL